MTDLDPNALDPGIRRTVLWLRSLGWQTTDSGDGRSKPEGQRVLDIPHVVIVVRACDLIDETNALISNVADLGIPDAPWDQDTEDAPNNPMVHGTYGGGDMAEITVINLHDGILPAGYGEYRPARYGDHRQASTSPTIIENETPQARARSTTS